MNSLTLDDRVRLAYRVDGAADAPALVFVNSLGADLHMWRPQIDTLSQSLRVIRYDTRGHGQSDAPDGPYSIDRLGRDLLALLDHLGIARTYICGISLGGMIALWFAAHHPERVERAVFANTAARIGTRESWSARIDAVRAGGMAAVRDTVIARFFSAQFRARHPEVTDTFGERLEAADPAGYVAACAALRDADLSPLVAMIRVPSLIVAGALDEATPPSQSEQLCAAIVGGTLVVLPEAGHLSNVEQPAAFSRCLLSFLTQKTALHERDQASD